MVCLSRLRLDGTPIKTLPELPPSLTSLTASDCESLETTMISTITLGSLMEALDFANCFKLDQKPLIAAMHLKIQSGEKISLDRIQMVLPGSEIPEWFRIYLKCHVESKNGDGAGDDDEVFFSKYRYTKYKFLKTCDSDHMFLHYELGFVDALRKYSGKEVTFKFYNTMSNGKGHVIRKPCKLKSCGKMTIAMPQQHYLWLYEHDETRDLHLAQYAKESHLLIPDPGCSFIGDKLQNENEKALIKAANICIQKITRS
ncbi:hypothetical protein OIU84_027368 [Salix udensis]|uniref:Uncharacterized protein n=1 Tax=Salix udensis TaxID=889485 RepID=A0AAD6P9Q0_9ROSI|nr:hypothetical protein OIU84_027368 [Salix udensis]